MHLVLPKSSLVEKIYPHDAVATSQATGTSGSYSAYSQIVASTSADFVLQGAVVGLNFTEAIASFNADILFQMQLATGGAGAESVIEQFGDGMDVRFDFVAGAVARLQRAKLYRFVPKVIPSGTRLAMRSSSLSTHGLSACVYLIGYEPSAGYPPPTRRQMSIERYIKGHHHVLSDCLPDAAATNLTTDATTTWVPGSWVEYHSGVTQDTLVTGLVNGLRTSSPLTRHAVVEIGTGAAGSEVARARVPLPGITAQNGPMPGMKELIRPLYVPVGTRIAARIKGNTTSMTVPVFLTVDEVL